MPMNRKAVVAGHICLDITPVFPTGRSYAGIAELLEPGKLIHMEEADVHTGGSVANTGLALKILGADVKLMGKIGNDALGKIVQQTADSSSISQTGARLKLDPALWADRRGIQPCFAADQVLSGTGAGDTSIAAFLAAVLNGEDPAMCTALAAAEGACSVTTYDALSGLRPLDELKDRIRAGWKTKAGQKSM